MLADGVMRLWRTSDWGEWATFDAGSPAVAFTISPDGKTLAVACADKTVRLVEVMPARR